MNQLTKHIQLVIQNLTLKTALYNKNKLFYSVVTRAII
jgi:hypothetical protein